MYVGGRNIFSSASEIYFPLLPSNFLPVFIRVLKIVSISVIFSLVEILCFHLHPYRPIYISVSHLGKT
jgi:hypothetical protein